LNAVPEQGYVAITREWKAGDTVELELPLAVRAVHGHEKIAATKDRVAFERGPVVYCVEDVDWAKMPADLVVPAGATLAPESRPRLLGGVTVLTIDGARVAGKPTPPVTAIPYFAWNNRGLAPMAVWVRQETARVTQNTAPRDFPVAQIPR
jgi:DUF1680 family protein